MSIPLINEVNKNDINTSIIAIKKDIERINTLLGLNNTEEIDTSVFATKAELEQAETDLAPVDEVTLNNMHSVTSNAVSRAMSYSTEEVDTGKKWIDGKIIYRQTFNIGNLPNNTAKVINFSIPNLNDITKVEGIANSTNIVLPIPYTSPDNTERITVYVAKIWGNIIVNTTSDMSTYYGCIVLEYTKQ